MITLGDVIRFLRRANPVDLEEVNRLVKEEFAAKGMVDRAAYSKRREEWENTDSSPETRAENAERR